MISSILDNDAYKFSMGNLNLLPRSQLLRLQPVTSLLKPLVLMAHQYQLIYR